MGLTKEDAQAKDNKALRKSCENGHISIVRYLKEEFGLTREDAQARNNYALTKSCENRHLTIVKYLKNGFGLTKEDAQKMQERRNSLQRWNLSTYRYPRVKRG